MNETMQENNNEQNNVKQMTRATTQQYTKRTTEHMHLIKYRVKELFLSADVMPMPGNSI